MRYDAHEQLVAPARPRARIWRLPVGIALIGVIYAILLAGWFMLEFAAGLPRTGEGGLGTTPWTAMILLATFGFLFPGLWLTTRWLHRRRLRTLFGPRRAFLRDAGRTALAALAVYALGLLLPGGTDITPVPNRPFGDWALWLLPAALALLTQVAAEETLFRGYLQSQLAARFRSPVIWLILPAVAFGLLHYSAAEGGANATLLILPPIAFGLLAGDLTARSGTLGPAITLHFFNNFAAVLLVAPGTPLSGLALYRLPVEMSDPAIRAHLPVELAMMLVLWLAARVMLRR